jgi:acid phosphatase type 7
VSFNRLAVLGAGVLSIGVLSACQPSVQPSDDPVLIGAGDIATCEDDADEATAELIEDIPGTVFTLGDNAYEAGTAEEYAECYEPGWGRFKDRTRPAIGNHEYFASEDAAGYFGYFGEDAGEAGKGWYSYDVGGWHIVVLNSECEFAGGCDETSEQGQWLKADLEANARACMLAYWHTPRFSPGGGFNDSTEYFWQMLYEHDAELILNGHDHFYVRFAPQTPDGVVDEARGIRQITVGTGGAELFGFDSEAENIEARNQFAFGVLKLTLRPDRYEWEFISTGILFSDSGENACH